LKHTTNKDYIFKTKPGYALICIGIIGLIFFGSITRYLLNEILPIHDHQKPKDVPVLIIACVFLLFTIMSLWLLLNIKIFTLTDGDLIISRPLLCFNKSIPLIQIMSIRQSDDPINMSRGFSTTTIYLGKKATIQLSNGKKLKFSSIEIGGYKVLIKEINQALGRLKRNH